MMSTRKILHTLAILVAYPTIVVLGIPLAIVRGVYAGVLTAWELTDSVR